MNLEEQSTRDTHLSPPRPLNVHKSSSPLRAPRDQTQPSNSNDKPVINAPLNPVKFPPRTSSMRDSNAPGNSSLPDVPGNSSFHGDQAQHRENHRSAASSNGNSSIASERSTVSSIKASYVTDSSSAIMGDFIPITPVDIKTVQPPKKGFVVTDNRSRDSQPVVRYDTAENRMYVFHSFLNVKLAHIQIAQPSMGTSLALRIPTNSNLELLTLRHIIRTGLQTSSESMAALQQLFPARALRM
jgi:hypothetical protein